MNQKSLPSFYVVGISVRTTNENGQSNQDLQTLWKRFFPEGILDKIPNKVDSNIYCVYTDYEKDHTKPYTTILGCKVTDLKNIPEGMVGKEVPASSYAAFLAKGDIHKGMVYQMWDTIWKTHLNRKYTADFEVYDERSMNPDKAEVEIFVAVQ